MKLLARVRATTAVTIGPVLAALLLTSCTDDGTPVNYASLASTLATTVSAVVANETTATAVTATTTGPATAVSSTTTVASRARNLNRAQRELARVFQVALGRPLDADAKAAAFNYGAIPPNRSQCAQDVLEKSFRIVTSREAITRQGGNNRRLAAMLYQALLDRKGEASGIKWHAGYIKQHGVAADARYMQEGDDHKYRSRLATICT